MSSQSPRRSLEKFGPKTIWICAFCMDSFHILGTVMSQDSQVIFIPDPGNLGIFTSFSKEYSRSFSAKSKAFIITRIFNGLWRSITLFWVWWTKWAHKPCCGHVWALGMIIFLTRFFFYVSFFFSVRKFLC